MDLTLTCCQFGSVELKVPVDMIMNASGEQRRQQLRRLVHDANPSLSPPGYARFDDEIQLCGMGLFNTSISISELHKFYIASRATLLDPLALISTAPIQARLQVHVLSTPLRAALTPSRCQALQGILRWNDDTSPEGRRIQLPTVRPGFCSLPADCRQLEPLIGNRDLMLGVTLSG